MMFRLGVEGGSFSPFRMETIWMCIRTVHVFSRLDECWQKYCHVMPYELQ